MAVNESLTGTSCRHNDLPIPCFHHSRHLPISKCCSSWSLFEHLSHPLCLDTYNLPFKVQTESQFLGMFSLSTAYYNELLWLAVLCIVYVQLSYFLRFFESVMKIHLYVLKISISKKKKRKEESRTKALVEYYLQRTSIKNILIVHSITSDNKAFKHLSPLVLRKHIEIRPRSFHSKLETP